LAANVIWWCGLNRKAAPSRRAIRQARNRDAQTVWPCPLRPQCTSAAFRCQHEPPRATRGIGNFLADRRRLGMLPCRGKCNFFALTLTPFVRIFRTNTFYAPLSSASLVSTSNRNIVCAGSSNHAIPSARRRSFEAILLKNVGDSPYSVRFCRNVQRFFPPPSLNFS
jgi:hypothetical protein